MRGANEEGAPVTAQAAGGGQCPGCTAGREPGRNRGSPSAEGAERRVHGSQVLTTGRVNHWDRHPALICYSRKDQAESVWYAHSV